MSFGNPSPTFNDVNNFPSSGEGGGGGGFQPVISPGQPTGDTQTPKQSTQYNISQGVQDFILAQIEELLKKNKEKAQIETATSIRDASRARQRALAGLPSATPGTILGGPQVGTISQTGGTILGGVAGNPGNQRRALGK